MALHPDCRLTFGLSAEGSLVPVEQAENGLGCELVCPGCKGRLIAVQGPVYAWHFRHESEEACATGYESMAHLLAKQIIAEEKRLKLPPVVAQYARYQEIVHQATEVFFDSVNMEVWMDGIRPDVIGHVRNRELLIEVAVTHECEQGKLDMLRRRELPAIEIDLAEFRHHLDVNRFRQAVIVDAPRKWLFNGVREATVQRLKHREMNRIEWQIIRDEEIERQDFRRVLDAAEAQAIADAEAEAREREERAKMAKFHEETRIKWLSRDARIRVEQEILDKRRARHRAEMSAWCQRVAAILYTGAITTFNGDKDFAAYWVGRLQINHLQSVFLTDEERRGKEAEWWERLSRAGASRPTDDAYAW